jgi:hypothetical protein
MILIINHKNNNLFNGYMTAGIISFFMTAYYYSKKETFSVSNENPNSRELNVKSFMITSLIPLGLFVFSMISIYFFENPLKYSGWMFVVLMNYSGKYLASYLITEDKD